MNKGIFSIISLLALTSFANAELPKITVYTESYCPGCISFEEHGYKELLNNPSKDLLVSNFDIVVFGNAHELPESKEGNRKFTCQHGDKECFGNKVDNCVQHYLDSYSAGQFLVCAGTKVLNSGYDYNKAIDDCLSGNKEIDKIKSCSNSQEGDEYQHLAAQKTGDHKYVPYILLNDKHTEDLQQKIQKDLVGFLCEYNDLVGKVEGCPSKSFIQIIFNKGLNKLYSLFENNKSYYCEPEITQQDQVIQNNKVPSLNFLE